MILGSMRDVIAAAPLATIDYLEVVNADTLRAVAKADSNSLITVAAFFGRTRLIDNLRLS
jgi:pantoate--beta-alanine ligase